MKKKIKNGYFFMYDNDIWVKVGSRCYMLPLYHRTQSGLMFKYVDKNYIQEVWKPNGERVK